MLTHFSSIIVQVSTKLLKDFKYELINIVFLLSPLISSVFMKMFKTPVQSVRKCRSYACTPRSPGRCRN